MTQTFGTISVVYGFPATLTSRRRGASSPASSGFVTGRQFQSSVSRQSGQSEVRTWELHFKDMSASERDSLLASFDDGLAGSLPVLVTPPPPDDGASVPVRFKDKLRIEYVKSAQCYRATAEVEEVI